MLSRVCLIQELPAKGFKVVETGGRSILVGQINGRPYAWLDRCPHAGIPLRQGRLSGQELTCHRHGWTFDLSDGCSVPDNPAFKLTAIPLTVEHDAIFVEVQEC